MPEEVRFFRRIAVYAFVVAALYWFVSYEPAGTVLLTGFGVATGAAFLVLNRARHDATSADLGPDGPFGDESGPVPVRSIAPLELAFGLAIAALGLAFGIWFVIAGALPIAAGAADWLGSAGKELRLLDRETKRPRAP
jgi:hypothetical protein